MKTCVRCRCLEDQCSTDRQNSDLQEKPSHVEQSAQNKAPQEKPSRDEQSAQNKAPQEKPSRNDVQSSASLAPPKAAEESETPEIGAMTHSQPDDGNAQVHDNDVGSSLAETELTACMFHCEPLEGPIPSG